MRAITLHQPWASLIALGSKRIETRSWRAPQALIGKTIAIHAGASPASWKALDAPYLMSDRTAITAVLAALPGVVIDERSWCAPYISEGAIRFSGLDLELPLGAVVATATLEACLPMVRTEVARPDTLALHLCNGPAGDTRLYVARLTGYTVMSADCTDVTDQRPYGDFAPGRWAWMLTDIKATTERCPACERTPETPGMIRLKGPCDVCLGLGKCPPVPAKGRQGIWTWTP